MRLMSAHAPDFSFSQPTARHAQHYDHHQVPSFTMTGASPPPRDERSFKNASCPSTVASDLSLLKAAADMAATGRAARKSGTDYGAV